jgi:hypothetical protein
MEPKNKKHAMMRCHHNSQQTSQHIINPPIIWSLLFATNQITTTTKYYICTDIGREGG